MNNEQKQLNPGSNASDFQPTTQNPQTIGGSNLQSQSGAVQPVQPTTGFTAEQLYQKAISQPSLVVETDKYSANTLVAVRPELIQSNSSLVTASIALALLLIIMLIVQRYWTRSDIPVSAADANPDLPAVSTEGATMFVPEPTTQQLAPRKKVSKKTASAKAKMKPGGRKKSKKR